ncbi:MAG: hypothetical protein AAFN79_07150 [Pseudomonadota bacterium]
MKRFLFATCLAALAASPAATSDLPMSGPEFRAASEGWTLYFETLDGEYFGAEQYFENGESLWSPVGAQCIPGVWRAYDERICFVHYNDLACWRVYGEDGEVAYAQSAEPNDTGLTLRVTRRDKSPVLCGEDAGV